MKTKLTFLFALIYIGNIYGQYTDHIITDNAFAIYSVYSANIDGDADIDVLSVSTDDNKVAWYENDGNGTFTEHIISTSIDEPNDIFADDIDGDGDTDVLVAYWDSTNTVAWFENTDGAGTFTMHIISNLAIGISVRTGDINGDGHMDIISAHKPIDTIVWYENDGSNNFSVAHTITTGVDGVRTVYVGDLDNDGDLDVASNGQFDGKISWHENIDGNGSFFTHPPIITAANGAWRVNGGDIDGDGDDDVLACVNDAEIYWCEYVGAGNWVVHEVSTNSLYVEWVYAADIDKDGDMDILSADQGDNQVVWHENNGNQDFSNKIVVSGTGQGPRTVHAAEVNGEGDMDIISGWWGSNMVVWTELVLGMDEYALSDLCVYPNPTTGLVTVDSESSITRIKIYNQLGQLVASNIDQNTIDISIVRQGIYFIEVMDENGDFGIQKIVKK